MPYDEEEPPYVERETYVEPDAETNALAKAVIGAAIEVHKQMGAGLHESIYERSLCVELRLRGIPFECQKVLYVTYKGEPVGEQRVDLIVGGKMVVELKAVESLAPIHTAQLITYLKLTKCKLGLINFNQLLIKEGIKRIVSS